MPKTLADIPNAYQGIIRPVMFSVVKQLQQELRLPKETQVFIPGSSQSTPMNGGLFGDCCEDAVTFPSATRIVMNFREEPAYDSSLITALSKDDTPTAFDDPVRGVSITPLRRMVKVNCDLIITGQSRSIVQRMVDYVRMRISHRWSEFPLTIQYSYLIPDGVMSLLMEINRLTESSLVPLQMSFGKYFEMYRSTPMLNLTTMNGNTERVAITETQEEVIGWFDFNDTPMEPERSSENDGSYTVNMTFSFVYARPSQLKIEWPLLVHQQLIGPKFRPKHRYRNFHDITRKVTSLKGILDKLARRDIDAYPECLQLPEIDDWTPKEKLTDTLTLLRLAVSLAKEEGDVLFDFAKLSKPWKIGVELLEFISHLGDDTFKRMSFFELMLFEGDTQIPFEFKIDGTRVVCLSKLDLRKTYHVELGIARNWCFVSSDNLEGIRRYPKLFYQLVKYLRLPIGRIPFQQLDIAGKGKPRIPSTKYPGEGAGRDQDKGGTLTHLPIDQAVKETSGNDPVTRIAGNENNIRNAMFLDLIALREEPEGSK